MSTDRLLALLVSRPVLTYALGAALLLALVRAIGWWGVAGLVVAAIADTLWFAWRVGAW